MQNFPNFHVIPRHEVPWESVLFLIILRIATPANAGSQ